jgi:hypothetical protein
MTEPEHREADRPWERPGALRRDTEPHLGRWFMLLTGTNLLVVVLSVAAVACLSRAIPIAVQVSPGMFVSPGDGLLLLPIALCLPIGIVTCALASRHLAQMRAGLVDSAGARATKVAQRVALLAMVVGAAAAVLAIRFLYR